MYIKGLAECKRLRGGVDAGFDNCWLLYRTTNSASLDIDNVVLRVYIS